MNWRGRHVRDDSPLASNISAAQERALNKLTDTASLESVLQAWYSNEVQLEFPILAHIAVKILSIPPSTSSVERLFSTVKFLYNSRRTSLADGAWVVWGSRLALCSCETWAALVFLLTETLKKITRVYIHEKRKEQVAMATAKAARNMASGVTSVIEVSDSDGGVVLVNGDSASDTAGASEPVPDSNCEGYDSESESESSTDSRSGIDTPTLRERRQDAALTAGDVVEGHPRFMACVHVCV